MLVDGVPVEDGVPITFTPLTGEGYEERATLSMFGLSLINVVFVAYNGVYIGVYRYYATEAKWHIDFVKALIRKQVEESYGQP